MYSSNMSSQSNTTIMDQNNQMILPFQIRFENTLKESNILNKCRYLYDLICESFTHNIKEIHHRFVLLVEDIFSVRNSTTFSSFDQQNFSGISGGDWRLKSLTREKFPKEFDTICSFLFHDGPVFKLMRHLMNDSNQRYEFPLNYLPNSLIQKTILGTFQSNFFIHRMTTSSNYLNLNAFEFYMFHFACYITRETNFAANPMGSFDSLSHNNIDNINVLYYVLLENYLEYFIPINMADSSMLMIKQMDQIKNAQHSSSSPPSSSSSISDAKSSIWNTLSSTTTNFWNLSSATSNNKIDQSQPMIQPTIQTATNFNKIQGFVGQNFGGSLGFNETMTMPRPSVLNSKILLFQNNRFLSPQQQNFINESDDRNNDLIGTIVYKCETVLSIFSEIWLNNDCNINSNNTMNTMIMNNFNISVEHMRVVRIFIKHLHYFCNSLKNGNGGGSSDQYNSGGFISGSIGDPLDEIKKNLWSSKYSLHKNLYQFLCLIFDRWPNDSSFRVPLETWLSYIQPWRYIPKKNFSKELNANDQYFDWKRFVTDNLFFYTKLFRQVITRISKQLDLNSTYNSLLIYRVLKVFAQNNLKDWIKEAEMTTAANVVSEMNSISYNNKSNQTIFSSTMRHHQSPGSNKTHSHLIDPEPFPLSSSSSIEYVSIFGPGFRDQIIELLFKIAKSIYLCEESSSKSEINQNNTVAGEHQNKSSTPFIDSVVNFFKMTSTNINSNESNRKSMVENNIEKIKNHLQSSIDYIAFIFDIPKQSIDTILANARKAAASSANKNYFSNGNNEQNIYQLVDGVPQLTEYGRNQILKGSLKLHNTPKILEGNPDTQPVRSYEVGILVKIALLLSTIINQKFGPLFQEYYHKSNSIYGTLFRLILSPPVAYTRFEKQKSNHQLKPQIIIEHLPPRINLRFISRIDFLVYSLVFMLFFKIFHWIQPTISTIILTIFIMIFIYFLCKLIASF